MNKSKFIQLDDGKLQRINLIIGVIISLVLTLGFCFLAVPNVSKRNIKINNMYFIDSSRFSKGVNLIKKQDYIFKLKYNFTNANTEEVMLNGSNLELKRSKDTKVIRTRYYYAPKEIIKKGKNFLKINFYPSNPLDIDLRIRNYIACLAGGNIVVTLRPFVREERGFLWILGIVFFMFSLVLWMFYTYLGKVIYFKTKQALFNNIILFLPWVGLYFILGLLPVFAPYSLSVSPLYLFGILLLGTLIPNTFYILSYTYSLIHLSNSSVVKFNVKSDTISRMQSKILSIIIDYKIFEKVNSFFYWFKLSNLSDKCVLLFIVLLVFSAVFIILSMEWLAYKFANIAYMALVLGLVIKLVKMFGDEKNQID